MGGALKKFLILFLMFFGAVGWAADKQKLAVYKLTSKNLRADQLSEISNAVTVEFRKYGEYDVMDWASLKEMIANVQEQKNFSVLAKDGSKAECLEDRCFMELGSRLGVELNFIGSVAQIGNRYSVTFKLQDVEKLAVMSIVQTQIKGDIGNILDSLPNLVARLLGKEVQGVVPVREFEPAYKPKSETTKKVEFAESDELVLVQFRTEPVGARVLVDGEQLCSATPCQKMINTKKHTIEMDLSGFKSKSFPFQASEKNKQIDVNLSPRMGGVIIGASMGENDIVAEVYINGVLSGKTPFKKEIPLSAKVSVKYGGTEKEVNVSDLIEGGKKKFNVEFEDKTPPGMVSIPAGCFQMGSNDGGSHEEPVHKVCLSAYDIDIHEVTQGEYAKVMGANPHMNDGSCDVYDGSNWNQGRVSSSFYGDDKPVICVDHAQAGKYCSRIGKRLPTEAEWEYAARGASSSRGYKYSGSNNENDVAWYSGNSGNQTHAVCTKAKNEIGMCDMSGNVWEWVSDWYGYSYYGSSPSQDPKGAVSGSFRVLRGGSWGISASSLRSSDRGSYGPTDRSSTLGFRCVSVGR